MFIVLRRKRARKIYRFLHIHTIIEDDILSFKIMTKNNGIAELTYDALDPNQHNLNLCLEKHRDHLFRYQKDYWCSYIRKDIDYIKTVLVIFQYQLMVCEMTANSNILQTYNKIWGEICL